MGKSCLKLSYNGYRNVYIERNNILVCQRGDNMSNQDKEKRSDDSLEQKQKINDPNQDIEPQRETNPKPQESNRE